MTLLELIKKHGPPKLLIDHWNNSYDGFACFKYSKVLEWNQKGLFLSNKLIKNPSIVKVQQIIRIWKRKE